MLTTTTSPRETTTNPGTTPRKGGPYHAYAAAVREARTRQEHGRRSVGGRAPVRPPIYALVQAHEGGRYHLYTEMAYSARVRWVREQGGDPVEEIGLLVAWVLANSTLYEVCSPTTGNSLDEE